MIFINHSGAEVEVNDSPANIQAAEKAGWKPKGKSKDKSKGK